MWSFVSPLVATVLMAGLIGMTRSAHPRPESGVRTATAVRHSGPADTPHATAHDADDAHGAPCCGAEAPSAQGTPTAGGTGSTGSSPNSCIPSVDDPPTCTCSPCQCAASCWCKSNGGHTGSGSTASGTGSSAGTSSATTATTSTGTNSTGTSATGSSATGGTASASGTSATGSTSTGTNSTGTTSTGTTSTTGTGTTGTSGGDVDDGNGNDEEEEEEENDLRLETIAPKLVSGTNVKIHLRLSGKNGRRPEHLDVTLQNLSGTEPPTTLYTVDGNTTPTISLLIKFDSTHFHPGDQLRLSVHAENEQEGALDEEIEMTVYNRFERLYNHEFVTDHSFMNNVRTFERYTSDFRLPVWAHYQAYLAFKESSVLLISSHGDQDGKFLISNPPQWQGVHSTQTSVYPGLAIQAREAASQAKLPPVSLAFMFMCYTGYMDPSPLFTNLILTDWEVVENRAIVQWRVKAAKENNFTYDRMRKHMMFVDNVFGAMESNSTLHDAIYAYANLLLYWYEGADSFYNEYDFGPVAEVHEVLRVEGDHYMTLRGLYDASPAERSAGIWYKVVRR